MGQMYQEEETMVVSFSGQSMPQILQTTVIYGRYFEVWRLLSELIFYVHLEFVIISPSRVCIPIFPQIINISYLSRSRYANYLFEVSDAAVSHLGSGLSVPCSTAPESFADSSSLLPAAKHWYKYPLIEFVVSIVLQMKTWKYFFLF